MTIWRTACAFSSCNSIAISSRRVRTIRTPSEASPRMLPTRPGASRMAILAARNEEADHGADRGADADRLPGIVAHVPVGGFDGHARAVLDVLLQVAERLARAREGGPRALARGFDLRAALVFHRLQQLLGVCHDVLDVALDRGG